MGNFVKYSAALLLLSSLALVGCGGGKEKALVGHYKMVMKAPPGKENDPGFKAVQAIADKAGMDLNEDKTFKISAGPSTQEGTWSYADDKVTFNGKDDKSGKPTVASVEADGTLKPVDAGGGPEFYFQKDPK